jgi:threonine/homoserine/homoserine lactone efflux protein
LNASEGDADRISIVPMRRKGPATKTRFQSFKAVAARTNQDTRHVVSTGGCAFAQTFKTILVAVGHRSLHVDDVTGTAMAEHVLSFAEHWRALLTLVLSSAVVMGSPGPSTMSVMAVGAAFGLRRSLGYMFGLVLGTAAVLVAVATGVVAMLRSMPRLDPVLTFAAAAYIVYLAFRIATAPPLSKQDPTVLAPSFAAGFLLAIANPKAYFAIASVFTGSTLVEHFHAPDAVFKAAVLAIMILIIHICWLLGGASLTGFLRDPVRSRITNALFAVILIGTAIFPLMH